MICLSVCCDDELCFVGVLVWVIVLLFIVRLCAVVLCGGLLWFGMRALLCVGVVGVVLFCCVQWWVVLMIGLYCVWCRVLL